jgi:hypothetical protein
MAIEALRSNLEAFVLERESDVEQNIYRLDATILDLWLGLVIKQTTMDTKEAKQKGFVQIFTHIVGLSDVLLGTQEKSNTLAILKSTLTTLIEKHCEEPTEGYNG